MKFFAIVLVSSLLLTGCEQPDVQTLIGQINHAVGFELFKYKQKTLPSEVNEEMAQASNPDKSPSAREMAKANTELMAEMLKVVFHLEKVEDRSEFGSLAHTLNQGASLEGIYHGIVMGSRYRGMENSTKSASPHVLKSFVQEMADLQLSMRNPTEFQVEESRKAPNIDFPDGSAAQLGVGKKKETQEVTQKKERTALINELLQIFIGASDYTLKRVLADEALKKMDELKDSPAELAQWYAQFVLHMCDAQIDFGLELRNKPDFDFHFKFAQRMAPDRVKWEVINRYHRYLNWAIDHDN